MNMKRLAQLLTSLTLLTAIACAVVLPACSSAPEEPAIKDGSAVPPVIIDPYMKIANTLSKDSMEGVASDAILLATAAKVLGPQASKVELTAQALGGVTGISDARDKFGELSDAVIELVDENHLTLPEGARIAVCPMKQKPWIQKAADIENPYFGAAMFSCGSFR